MKALATNGLTRPGMQISFKKTKSTHRYSQLVNTCLNSIIIILKQSLCTLRLQPILVQYSISIPNENVRKRLVFWRFSWAKK